MRLSPRKYTCYRIEKNRIQICIIMYTMCMWTWTSEYGKGKSLSYDGQIGNTSNY